MLYICWFQTVDTDRVMFPRVVDNEVLWRARYYRVWSSVTRCERLTDRISAEENIFCLVQVCRDVIRFVICPCWSINDVSHLLLEVADEIVGRDIVSSIAENLSGQG